ncbi:hypothetical protein OIU77_006572 [Salix suchowensis]|uniref:Plant/F9H3-4 protein n=1 Tax=Salix suchowensis TaxID=1278906 RepID=A0ABQ9AMA7_9ROSI|nr:hypothetical protein OIU77_006572 [Salix suchowensis]
MFFDKGSMQSNLDSFLHCTTPLVQSQFLPKREIRNLNSLWNPWERDTVEYFTLGDLWNCYDEWSAYGAGVPITLDNGETLVQYYVPYLSAIQIYTSKSSVNSFREDTESGDGETRDSFSDLLSDDSESDRYFQYFERSTPYGRVPLMDKINGLARQFPGLMTLRNVDLSPASWMAVAWYPIYHIPMGRTIKDLSTCFLTYHTLSSSFQDMDVEDDIKSPEKKRKEGESITLPPFGLATYKMQGNVWVSGNCGQDQDRLVSLLSVADSWLKQLMVQHHDFNYFTRIN